jgi:hypothetical protein
MAGDELGDGSISLTSNLSIANEIFNIDAVNASWIGA